MIIMMGKSGKEKDGLGLKCKERGAEGDEREKKMRVWGESCLVDKEIKT